MQWTHHYTGIDYAEARWRGVALYLSRDSDTKRVHLARLSIPRRMLGLFRGRTNHVKGSGGWEVFTNRHHLGWAKEPRAKFFRVHWSGSIAKPWEAVTLRIGRFGIGGRTPLWLKRRQERRIIGTN